MGRPLGSKNKPKDALDSVKKVSLEENAKKIKERPVKGNPTSVCAKCRKRFNQEFIPEKNAYTSYNMCEECRAKDSYEKQRKAEEEGNTVFNALLNYTPFPAQQEMHKAFEDHRFLVLNCGNRTGKDRFSNMAGIMYFVECLNENRHIDRPDIVPSVYWWIIAPTETMAMQNWRELKKFFPKDWVVGISNTTMTMQTIGNGMIEVRSAYDPESLVGVGLDLVTITEAARIKDLEIVWANLEARLSSPGRGRAKDRKGHS